LLIYQQVFTDAGTKAADAWEFRFKANGWGGSWRNGVFAYHHFHSNAHEALAICEGNARIQFGGPSGPVLSVNAGDLAILPAGTAHKKIDATADFLVVGAYPAGQEEYDVILGEMTDQLAIEARIAATSIPRNDPAYGEDGPLKKYW
jgi:uncharacterized protein YjlB